MGVVFIKMTQNGLVLIGVSSLWETVVIGGLLIVVLVLDAVEERRVR
jgi:ribose transport system permease protein/AI-2 transport system permease protein